MYTGFKLSPGAGALLCEECEVAGWLCQVLPLSALEGVRGLGARLRYLAISRNAKSKLALPTDSKGCQGERYRPWGKGLQLKEDFWLRHLFQYQKEDQFILTPLRISTD